jgi:phosphatidylglycerol:prolipoprotein diacylglycerol transferase
MHPILLKIGPITLYTYGAMLVLAFSLSTWLAGRILRQLPPELQRLTPGQVVDLSCLALLGGIVGARLFFVVLHWQFFLNEPRYLLALWQGGLIWYGGFAGGVGTAWLYARRHQVSCRWVLDLFAPVLSLGHAVGRIGCFLNGCCYGQITDAWCGVIMPGEPRPVFPNQLAESLGLLFLYDETHDPQHLQMARDVISFIETHLYQDGIALHDWNNGAAATRHCTGCNFQLLYILHLLGEREAAAAE